MLYLWLAQFSAWISRPLNALVELSPLVGLTAFILGVTGALAPCHLAASVGSITYFGNRQLREDRFFWRDVGWYVVGKTAVYMMLGALFVLAGRQVLALSAPVLSWARMFTGPLLIMIGLVLWGRLRLPGAGMRLAALLEPLGRRASGRWGAFLLGAVFSLGFCPTMFWLFFGLLMPMSLQVTYGPLLPLIFAWGTAVPLLLFLGIFGQVGLRRPPIRRKLRRFGQHVQGVAGGLLIGLGLLDILTTGTHFLLLCLS